MQRGGAGEGLIVLLHGCGQDAASFAADTGWTALADQLAIPLVLPILSLLQMPQQMFRQWTHRRSHPH